MKQNLGVVQMGTHYYCAECKDSVSGNWETPDKIIIDVPESDKRSGMM